MQWRALGLSCLLMLGSASCNIHFNASGYRFDRKGEIHTRRQEGRFPDGVRQVFIHHRFGKVAIEGSKDGFGWSWDLRTWANDESTAGALAERIRLLVEETPERVSLELEIPAPPFPELRGIESNLTLRVPEETGVEIRNGFGSTTIQGLRGEAIARCEHGEVFLENLSGDLKASTSFGGLRARKISGGTFKNHHGSIQISGVRGEVDAETSFGRLMVENADGDINLRNSHGEVRVEDAGGKVEARTSFGRIQLFEVDGAALIRNSHGSIQGNGLRGDWDFETSFGSIDVQGEPVEVSCSNQHGSVELRMASPSLRRADVKTSFASMQIEVPRELPLEVDARAPSGSVKNRASDLERPAGGEPGFPAAFLRLRNHHGGIRIDYNRDS